MSDQAIQIGRFMGRGEGQAKPGGSRRNRGRPNGLNEEARSEQLLAGGDRPVVFAEDQGNDGGQKRGFGAIETPPKVLQVREEALPGGFSGGLGEQAKSGCAGGGDARRGSGRENEGSSEVDEGVDDNP